MSVFFVLIDDQILKILNLSKGEHYHQYITECGFLSTTIYLLTMYKFLQQIHIFSLKTALDKYFMEIKSFLSRIYIFFSDIKI